MAKEIPLTQGKVALVDDEDYEDLSKYRWFYTSSGYAARGIKRDDGTWGHEYMHRRILNLPHGIEGDHINRDTLDNRRSNLRPATNQQNNANRGLHKNNTSGYIGVYKQRGKWCARVGGGGRPRVFAGAFDNPEDAARARDRAAKGLYGEYVTLNFPEEV